MRRPIPQGFTLIEVAVAMAIVGITFAALFGQLSGSISNIPRIERANRLVDHARTKLNQVALLPVIAPDQHAEGRFDDDTTWEIDTILFVPPRIPDARHMVKVSVGVELDGRQLTFNTYRFQESIPPGTRPLGEQLDAIQIPTR